MPNLVAKCCKILKIVGFAGLYFQYLQKLLPFYSCVALFSSSSEFDTISLIQNFVYIQLEMSIAGREKVLVGEIYTN